MLIANKRRVTQVDAILATIPQYIKEGTEVIFSLHVVVICLCRITTLRLFRLVEGKNNPLQNSSMEVQQTLGF